MPGSRSTVQDKPRLKILTVGFEITQTGVSWCHFDFLMFRSRSKTRSLTCPSQHRLAARQEALAEEDTEASGDSTKRSRNREEGAGGIILSKIFGTRFSTLIFIGEAKCLSFRLFLSSQPKGSRRTDRNMIRAGGGGGEVFTLRCQKHDYYCSALVFLSLSLSGTQRTNTTQTIAYFGREGGEGGGRGKNLDSKKGQERRGGGGGFLWPILFPLPPSEEHAIVCSTRRE